jgi:hypothetical protein
MTNPFIIAADILFANLINPKEPNKIIISAKLKNIWLIFN